MNFGRQWVIRLTGIAALAGVNGLMISACSSGAATAHSVAATATSAAATLSPVSTPDPLASLSGDEVLTKALANLENAPTVRMTGSFSYSRAGYTLDLGLKPGHGCSGTIATDTQGSFKLVIIGKTIYFNPDDKFWTTSAGADAAAVIGIINGRWIKGSTSDKGLASFSTLCDLSKTVASAASGKGLINGAGTDVKGKVIALNGARVLPVHDSTGDVMDVTDTSQPELLSISFPKGTATAEAIKLAFSVGVPVTLTAPPASQVIDASQVGL
jgi:hypothetical protein